MEYFPHHLIVCRFMNITNLKKVIMIIKIFPLRILPLLGFARTNSQVEIPMSGNTAGEKQ
jgi:hypothetical protein